MSVHLIQVSRVQLISFTYFLEEVDGGNRSQQCPVKHFTTFERRELWKVRRAVFLVVWIYHMPADGALVKTSESQMAAACQLKAKTYPGANDCIRETDSTS